MNIILVMIPLSLLILAGAVAMFFWAVNHDQFEDMESPGLLPLADDPEEVSAERIEHSAGPGRRPPGSGSGCSR
ncbi:MAG: cbb3-type cytochrome oxidase assembly protein CcoS [Alloalcanivorax venustensis]|uniref:cbb3-type cytochrome oxidase assembly protein CcoS n=1 Tax=Alloalcanivorax venustensis TaxID=172371 RepID=UPI003C48A513